MNIDTTSALPATGNMGRVFERRLWLGLLLLNVLVAGFGGQFLYSSWLEQIKRAEHETRNLALSLEREIAGVFDGIDLSLKFLAESHAEIQPGRSDSAVWTHELQRYRGHLTLLSGLRRVAADVAPDAPGILDNFGVHRDQPSRGLLISQVPPGRGKPDWSLVLSRRLETKDGQFAGIIEATLPLQHFARRFKELKLGRDGSIGLRDGDLRLLLRHPELADGGQFGTTRIAADFTAALARNALQGSYRACATSIDGLCRFHSYRRNASYGFYVNVGMGEAELLASWHDELRQAVGFGVAFLLTTVLLAFYLQRARRSQELAQAEYVRSEAGFRELVAVAPYGIVIIDGAAGIQYLNPAFTAMLGYTREDIPDVASWWSKAYPDPDYRQQVMAVWQEAVLQPDAPGVVDREFKVCARDGNSRMIRFLVTKLGDGRIVVSLEDVTARHESDLALAASRQQYQELVEGTTDLIARVDMEGRFLYVNHAARAIFGLSPQDCIGRRVFDFIHPEDRRATSDAFAEWSKGDAPAIQFRNRQIDRDGAEHVMSWSMRPERNQDGEVCGFASIARDVTESVQAEAALREVKARLEDLVAQRTRDLALATDAAEASERFMHLVTDAVPGQIAYVNRELHYEFANKAYREWFGRTEEEMRGIHLRDLLGEDLYQKAQPFLQQALRGESLSFLRTTVSREGETVYLWANYVPDIRDGQVRGIIGLFSDITELKHAQLQLEQLNEQLQTRTMQAEAANIAKSAFLANMSHEIRTPMNGILGMASILRREGVTPKQAQRLETIDTSARHLLAVINDILDLSKIEAGRLALDELPFAVGDILENVRSILSERARAKGIALVIDLQPVPYQLMGDPTRLQQSLLNFAGNAVKFTDRGRVTLRVETLAESADSVLMQFTVEDTGMGVSAEVMPRLFSAFEQADNSLTRKYGGTGLGLAITKRLAAMMGGEVGAESTPGVGSRFWFTVRLKRSEQGAKRPPAEADAEAMIKERYSSHRVLVVDDEPINREVAVMHLESVELVVDVARDGLEAVALAKHNSYAAIFMDMQMPNLNGLEATRQIRQIFGHRHTPIIAMTANVFAEDKVQCLKAGMNDVLIKPVVPEELFATLLHWLSDGAD